MRIILLSVIANALLGPGAWAQVDVAAGERSYALCAGCHGFAGEGNQLVSAPRLAGVETWYLKRQMQNFANGIRGHLDGDVNGQRMAKMAQAVDSERKLDDLVTFIATLPASARASASFGGDVDRGRIAYSLCAACHGPQAQGNEAVESPGLAVLEGWYVAEQLRLYAEGLRGTHEDDTYGQQMRALSGSFADQESRRNLAAYIDSLEP